MQTRRWSPQEYWKEPKKVQFARAAITSDLMGSQRRGAATAAAQCLKRAIFRGGPRALRRARRLKYLSECCALVPAMLPGRLANDL